MRTFITVLLFLISIFLILPSRVFAITDPLNVPNNKFGIHIIDTNDLLDTSKLVNSSGGKWGYVTLVIREDERDVNRWNHVFDTFSNLNLIPIVRIATQSNNGTWEKFTEDDIGTWINFLNSLKWPIYNRYVVVGNEPNHATEWGGTINPSEYAEYLKNFSLKAKSVSDNFFILNAGFDASAPNSAKYMSEDKFIRSMLESDPHVFSYIDGWVSHSYPNPGFSGSSNDTGRGTVKTYVWERELLNSLGVEKELPVFITETGWAHDIEGDVLGQASYGSDRFNYKTIEEVTAELTNAFREIWIEDYIVAITPFILSHPDYPFENFSWKREDGSYYEFYGAIQQIAKVNGSPGRVNNWKIQNYYKVNDDSIIAVIQSSDSILWNLSDTNLISNYEVTIKPISTNDINKNSFIVAYVESKNGEDLPDFSLPQDK